MFSEKICQLSTCFGCDSQKASVPWLSRRNSLSLGASVPPPCACSFFGGARMLRSSDACCSRCTKHKAFWDFVADDGHGHEIAIDDQIGSAETILLSCYLSSGTNWNPNYHFVFMKIRGRLERQRSPRKYIFTVIGIKTSIHQKLRWNAWILTVLEASSLRTGINFPVKIVSATLIVAEQNKFMKFLWFFSHLLVNLFTEAEINLQFMQTMESFRNQAKCAVRQRQPGKMCYR